MIHALRDRFTHLVILVSLGAILMLDLELGGAGCKMGVHTKHHSMVTITK